ncbi:MAG: hypothetical protein [Microviridae sp.]|nr:MAG: hypothetical protein [Microviridae sp.]
MKNTTESQKKTTQKESLQLQTSVEENTNNSNSGETTDNVRIEDSPFRAVKTEEGWFIVMGNHRLTEPVKTLDECLAKCDTEKWLLVMHVAVVVAGKLLEDYKQREETAKHNEEQKADKLKRAYL